jgi:hypothetical protein
MGNNSFLSRQYMALVACSAIIVFYVFAVIEVEKYRNNTLVHEL